MERRIKTLIRIDSDKHRFGANVYVSRSFSTIDDNAIKMVKDVIHEDWDDEAEDFTKDWVDRHFVEDFDKKLRDLNGGGGESDVEDLCHEGVPVWSWLEDGCYLTQYVVVESILSTPSDGDVE